MCFDFITTPFEPQRHKDTEKRRELLLRRFSVSLCLCGSLPLPVQHSSWTSRCHCLPFEYNLTVDNHFCEPFGILMRVCERGRITNSCWIKHNDVRSHSRP